MPPEGGRGGSSSSSRMGEVAPQAPYCGCFGADGALRLAPLERMRMRRLLGDERLADSEYFLYLLQTEFPDLWQTCVLSTDDVVVCVPQSTSLPAKVTREDAETHVLLPAAVPGEFFTLNGRRVGLVGTEVVTLAGFDEPRRVRLLRTEERLIGGAKNAGSNVNSGASTPAGAAVADSDEDSFFAAAAGGGGGGGGGGATTTTTRRRRGSSSSGSGPPEQRQWPRVVSAASMKGPLPSLSTLGGKAKAGSSAVAAADETSNRGTVVRLLHVSQPLAGGLAARDESEEVDQAAVAQLTALLRTHPELEAVFADMDAFAEQLNALAGAAPDALSRVRPSLRAVVRGQWERASAALVASGCLTERAVGVTRAAAKISGGGSSTSESHRVLLAQVAESYLMQAVHGPVYSWMARTHGKTDEALSRALLRMRNRTQADIGVRAEFQCAHPAAVAAVAAIGGAPTPMDKLLALKRATTAIRSRLQQHLEAHHADSLGELELATDDLVLLLVHAFAQAHPFSCSLLTDLRYIRAFHFVESSTSAVGFALGTFAVALEWLVAKEGLMLVEDEGSEAAQQWGLDVLERPPPAPRLAGGASSSHSRVQGDAAAAEGGDENVEAAAEILGEQLEEEEEEEEGLGAAGLRSIVEMPAAATDVACRANVLTVLQEFDCREDVGAVFADPLAPLPAPLAAVLSRSAAAAAPATKAAANVAAAAASSSSSAAAEAAAAAPAVAERGSTVVVYGDAGPQREGGGGGSSSGTYTVTTDDSGGRPRATGVVAAACGWQCFAVVTSAGQLQTWGVAEGGRLGHGRDADVGRPTAVAGLHGVRIAAVACGRSHMLAATAEGGLFAWGDNRCGQLGIGVTGGMALVPQVVAIRLSNAVNPGYSSATGRRGTPAVVRSVAAGGQHSLALTDDGAVYSWGRAAWGQLGRVADHLASEDLATPAAVASDFCDRLLDVGSGAMVANPNPPAGEGQRGRIICIAAGWAHSLAVTEKGSVYAWGCGGSGRLGLGSHADAPFPLQVRALAAASLPVVAAAAGYAHSLFLTATGAVFACGDNRQGQVGCSEGAALPPQEAVLVPQRVAALAGQRVRVLTAGERHSAAVTREGNANVFTWGANNADQCGHGRGVSLQRVPREAEAMSGARLVACGGASTLAVIAP